MSDSDSLKSEFLTILSQRGFIHQASALHKLDAKLQEGAQTAYIGFDCTADSLHVGSLLPIMVLRWWQKTGHNTIIVMGGGTTRIGDPSGKDESRKMLDDSVIEHNMQSIQKIFNRYLDFDRAPNPARMIDNYTWLKDIDYITFLRDYGTHFTINRMMTFESVKLRLEREQPLTFLEFNYMILQAYDFLQLYQRHNCILQMGGSDQWGNIINGVDLTRRIAGAEVFALTTPLLTTASGAKMGKTASGAIWLNQDKLSPYDFWQFWRNTEDADIGRFLRLFTELPLEEIKRLETLKDAEINEAKKILAFEVTKLAHGEAAATKAAQTAKQTFEQGEMAEDLPTLTLKGNETTLAQIMVELKFSTSLGEARRLIKGGGVKLNSQTIEDEWCKITPHHFNQSASLKLSVGKKRHALLKISL